MIKFASSGNKHKKHRFKVSHDLDPFKIGSEAEEKAHRHRIAQSEYYARNAEGRARRLKQAAERRDAAKLKKRRWDAPKTKRIHMLPIAGALASAQGSNRSGEVILTEFGAGSFNDDRYDFKDPRAQTDSGLDVGEQLAASDLDAAVGSTASPTSEERLAISALAQLAEGVVSNILQDTEPEDNSARVELRYDEFRVNENAVDDWRAGSVDSILEMANQLSSHESDAAHAAADQAARAAAYIDADSNVPLAVQRGELPPGMTSLSRVQEMSLQINGHIGRLTTIQAAQLEVVKVNSGALSIASPEDAASWSRRPTLTTDQWPRCDWTKKEVGINCWRMVVCDAVERYRRKAARKEARATAEDAKLGRWFQERMREQRLVKKALNDEIWASGGVSEGDEA
ncbi:hypothetical protein C8R43DRAFT_1136750 [Mycena crocata]|nr:hypothetical protein C8R43DRAFT_1136750 [Mycena crocata]